MQEVAAVDVTRWEMEYDDMVLKKQVGSGHFGVVMLACLKREATSPSVTRYISKHTILDGRPPPLLVALKQFSGENCQHRTAVVKHALLDIRVTITSKLSMMRCRGENTN